MRVIFLDIMHLSQIKKLGFMFLLTATARLNISFKLA